jgi:hypothetical protein
VHLHQFPGAADAGRDDPGGGVFLEALGVEHAALAAVEGEDSGVGRQAGEGLVDDRARDALALRVARDRGQESVEVAAAWRGERGGGEEQQDEGKEEAAHAERGCDGLGFLNFTTVSSKNILEFWPFLPFQRTMLTWGGGGFGDATFVVDLRSPWRPGMRDSLSNSQPAVVSKLAARPIRCFWTVSIRTKNRPAANLQR